jgi:hypothetical protein
MVIVAGFATLAGYFNSKLSRDWRGLIVNAGACSVF